MKTYPELKQLALDISDGRVFGTWMIREGDLHLLGLIFMLLQFLNEEDRKEKPAAIYEYYTEAGHQGINGYPIFWSCCYLNQEEVDQLQPMLELIDEQKQQFLEM